MPLVVMCGLPCSGKSQRVKELLEFLKANCDKEVDVVTDDYSTVPKNDLYASPREEKMARGALRSAVERYLSPDRIIILDSLNYIKGFRYELYCVSKLMKTPQCVVLCETPVDTAREWNQERDDQSQKYSDEIFEAIVMRFEPPDSRNRWDSPLFLLHTSDPLPCQEIADALLSRKPPPPNLSTQSQPLSSTSFLHELDRKTQEIMSTILEAQRSGTAGSTIVAPGTTEKVCVSRSVTMAELRRLRRQFITYTKLHPVEDCGRIPTLFVQYLNSML